MLMYKQDGGYHNFADHDVEAAKKDGWVDGTFMREAAIALKNPVTIETQPAPRTVGRPRKDVSAFGEV